MSPKELEFLYLTIERTARATYQRGYKDGKEGRPPNTELTLSKESKMILKTNLDKHVNSR